MTARQVILLRHGVTDWNATGRFQGHADVPLNQNGLAQAAAAAEALAGQRIGRVVASDLSRARVTAEIVAARLEVDVTLDDKLREINVGSWAGRTMSEVEQSHPDFRADIEAGRDFRRSAGGETGAEAGDRVVAAIRRQAEASPDDEVLLVVGHGLTSRLAAATLLGLTYADFRLFVGLGNCHWLVLQPGDRHWRLIAYNRTS
jgi:glucosyl-3-phosphoglycerate phosphatase